MMVKRVVLALVAVVVWEARSDAATSPAVKFCGRQLGEIMSRVCHAYNSPSWDVPTVEQPSTTTRRKRQLPGIADECCIIGCTWKQLSEYCSISAYSESPLEELEAHIIADRSAERAGVAGAAGGAAGVADSGAAPVGSGYSGARTRGYGRSRPKARRCWCRRKRREGRRRSSLMGPRKKCSSRCARSGHRFAPDNVGKDSQH